MTPTDIPLAALRTHLDRLAQEALVLWDLPAQAHARLINVSENFTYLVEAGGGFRAVLRVHREDYHSRRAISSELAWMDALGRDNVIELATPYPGRDGRVLQSATSAALPTPRHLVLFQFVAGTQPSETEDLTAAFRQLGLMAARMHLHAMQWQLPEGFERPVWDEHAVFGPKAIWGDWRNAPGVDHAMRPLLEQTEQTLRARLAAYGKRPSRFGLIHADMRLANLLVDGTDTRLIDFDDCGFGWFMYDFAAAISFIETDPAIPALKTAWLSGYRSIRDLPEPDADEIDTFIMLRRMALLAWIGSHIEAPEPQAMAPHFAAGTAQLARDWLARQPAPDARATAR